MSEEKRNILNTINSPDDLKKVPEDDLIQLCKELREKIIDECSEHPGHFGAGLGVVELTVAWWRQRLPCIMFSLRLRISLYLMYLIRAILIRF